MTREQSLGPGHPGQDPRLLDHKPFGVRFEVRMLIELYRAGPVATGPLFVAVTRELKADGFPTVPVFHMKEQFELHVRKKYIEPSADTKDHEDRWQLTQAGVCRLERYAQVTEHLRGDKAASHRRQPKPKLPAPRANTSAGYSVPARDRGTAAQARQRKLPATKPKSYRVTAKTGVAKPATRKTFRVQVRSKL